LRQNFEWQPNFIVVQKVRNYFQVVQKHKFTNQTRKSVQQEKGIMEKLIYSCKFYPERHLGYLRHFEKVQKQEQIIYIWGMWTQLER
jgi:hypothetical protein